LRAAVRAGVDAAGLRPVARELRLDPKSVKQLINGAEPRTSTRTRLVQWYLYRGDELVSAVDLARAAADVLLRDLPDAEWAPATHELVSTVRRIYERIDAVPRWLTDFEKQVKAGKS
jgi:hypothetical protein